MLHAAVIKIAVFQSAPTEGLLQGADEVTPPYLIAATLEIVYVSTYDTRNSSLFIIEKVHAVIVRTRTSALRPYELV